MCEAPATTNLNSVDVSIVIVNWNSLGWVRKCLPTIEHCGNLKVETLIVDNGSSDGSAMAIVQEFPWIRLIRSANNLGFAGANNLGFRHSRGRYILFLNPDTEVSAGAIERMSGVLDSHPSAAMLGAKLFNADGSIQTSCIQSFPTLANQALDAEAIRRRFPSWRLWGMQSLFDNAEQCSSVEVVSGACIMARRQVFEEVGGFNTNYFMYAEDTDLCFKVKQHGWDIIYIPSAHVIHYGGGTSTGPEGNPRADVVMRESIHTFLRLHRGPVYAFAYRCCMALVAVLRLAALLVMLGGGFRRERAAAFLRSRRKWNKVFRWAIGLESWARSQPSTLGPDCN